MLDGGNREEDAVTFTKEVVFTRALIIDDERDFPKAYDDFDEVTVVRTAHEGIDLLEHNDESHYDLVFLDHDLGDNKTIMPFMDYIGFCCFFETKDLTNIQFIIHTQNPAGREKIKRVLDRWDLHYSHTDAGSWQ